MIEVKECVGCLKTLPEAAPFAFMGYCDAGCIDLQRRRDDKARFEKYSAELLARENERKNREFFESRGWRELRYQALSEYGNSCMACGVSPKDGAVIQVDHIKPRIKYPDLALRLDNLQVLCRDCNQGKSWKHEQDWRDS